MFNFLKLKLMLMWALDLAIVALRTPFVNFEVSIPDLAEFVAERIKDGKLSDEDLADILQKIKSGL